MTQFNEAEPAGGLRPLPVPTAISAPFWEGCQSGQLLFQRCKTCGRAVFPPEAFCSGCLSDTLQWEESRGVGTIYTFTIMRSAPSPGFCVPTPLAIVELDEKYPMFTNIVEFQPDEILIGQRVEVEFCRVNGLITLPLFVHFKEPIQRRPMNLELSDDQRSLQEATQRFLQKECTTGMVRAWADAPEGFDRSWWRRGAELGWTAMLVPEELGGGNVSGSGLRDLVVMAEELGCAVAPGPFLPTNIVADAITRHGTEEHKGQLKGLVEGVATSAWCVEPFLGAWHPQQVQLTIIQDRDEVVVDGSTGPVEAAASADLLLVTGSAGGGITQVLVPSSTTGVNVQPMHTLDLVRRFAEVHFDSVRVPSSLVLGEPGTAQSALQRQLRTAAVLVCAELVGVMRRVFDFTLEYLNDRFSFGRPLASYQALKHRFAEMRMWLEACQAVTDAAVSAIETDRSDAQSFASAAKAYVGERATDLVQECVQMHGGIAMTWEHDIHLYLRRATLDRNLYGTPVEHRRIVGMLEGV